MRVLVIIYEFPPIGGGGGQAALDVSRELVKQGHEVRVLTSQFKGLPRQETVNGIQVTRIPAIRRLPYQADLTTMFGFIASEYGQGCAWCASGDQMSSTYTLLSLPGR